MGDTGAGNEPERDDSNGGSGSGKSWWSAGRLWLLPVLAVVVVLIGLVMILTSAPLGGWFGFPPLNTDFGFVAGNAVIVNNQELAGWVVLGLGVALLMFWLGFRLGKGARVTTR